MELFDKVLAKISENWVYATALISVLKESLQQRQIEARIVVTWGTTQQSRANHILPSHPGLAAGWNSTHRSNTSLSLRLQCRYI